MTPAPTPENELQRLAALLRLRLLDAVPDQSFEVITRCVSAGTGAPVALISLVDADRQWFMCRVGLDAQKMPREVSCCGHAILADKPLIVADALGDPRFADNPLVTGPPYVRAYLGIPLVTREGHALGTLCAIETQPKFWTPKMTASTVDLAKVTVALIEARALKMELGELFETCASLCRPPGELAA
jgi:GAF domain-containing protein